MTGGHLVVVDMVGCVLGGGGGGGAGYARMAEVAVAGEDTGGVG